MEQKKSRLLTLADVVMTMADLYKVMQVKNGDYSRLNFPNNELKEKFEALEKDIEKYPSTKSREEAQKIAVDRDTSELYWELTHDKTAKEYLAQSAILNLGWKII